MRVIVQSKSLEITKALRAFATRQAQKLAKLTDRAGQIYVYLETISKKRNDPQAASVQYSIHLPGKKAVVVKRQAIDMYSAIVDATERALRQVRKTKERRLTIKRQQQQRKTDWGEPLVAPF